MNPSSRRGGMSGQNVKPMSASAGRDRERVAPQRVLVAVLPVQEDHHAGGHDEVQRPVEVVARDDERLEVQRPLLEQACSWLRPSVFCHPISWIALR